MNILEEAKQALAAYEEARRKFWEGYTERQKVKEALKLKEAELIRDGKITGKNAQEREANMLAQTEQELKELSLAEWRFREADMELEIAAERLKTIRAMLNYMAAVEK